MNIVKISEIENQKIFDIFDQVKKNNEKTDDDSKESDVTVSIRKYIPSLSLIEEIAFDNILKSRSDNALTNFKEKNADIEFNLDGDSTPEAHKSWEIKEISLNTSYSMALQADSTKASQIINARTLNCLLNVKEYPYIFEKNKVSPVLAEQAEKYLALPEEYRIKRLLALVFEYIRNNKKPTFLEYVFYYLDILVLDTNKESALAKEYLNTIDNLLNKKRNK